MPDYGDLTFKCARRLTKEEIALPPLSFGLLFPSRQSRGNIRLICRVKVCEQCLDATSTDAAPWCIVPADDKENARLIVSRVLLDMLEGLDMAFPKANETRRRELAAIRQELAK